MRDVEPVVARAPRALQQVGERFGSPVELVEVPAVVAVVQAEGRGLGLEFLQLLVAFTKKGGYDYRTGMNGIEAVETYKAQPGLFGAVVIGSFSLFHFPYLALILTSH